MIRPIHPVQLSSSSLGLATSSRLFFPQTCLFSRRSFTTTVSTSSNTHHQRQHLAISLTARRVLSQQRHLSWTEPSRRGPRTSLPSSSRSSAAKGPNNASTSRSSDVASPSSSPPAAPKNAQLPASVSDAGAEVPKTLPGPRNFAYPERLCVYHAGTGRVTFLACLKVSTLFIFTFFAFVVTPAYLDREGLSINVLRTTASAIVPLAFVAYATSPFVTFIHLRLPPYARQSEEMLRRFVSLANRAGVQPPPPSPSFASTMSSPAGAGSAGGLTGKTQLEITTMSFIAKPRLSVVCLEELVPTNKRLGIVNFSRRDSFVEQDNKRRKWYMFPAVRDFSIPSSSNTVPKVPWVWEKVAERIRQL